MSEPRPDAPDVGTSPDIDPQLVRLRKRLVAREEVVKQLNRRLVDLERASHVPDADAGGTPDIRLAALESELQEERRARAAAEHRVVDLLAQLERLRTSDEPLQEDAAE